jgi:hypothetical protein
MVGRVVQHAGLERVGADVFQHQAHLQADEVRRHGHHARTPSVFCAVSAVIAVAAKPPSAVTALMSAWMPAPPPESEPAAISTLPFICTPPQR